MENDVDKEEDEDPLLQLYLPSKISSSHTCCKGMGENNNIMAYSDGNANEMETDDKIDLAVAYFEKEEYEKANEIFQSLIDVSVVAKYYVSIISYDGIGVPEDHVKAVAMMKEVVETNMYNHERLIHCAEYNIGRAYYEGFGVKQSDDEAEKWWLRSAHDGDEGGCVKAQSILAMFYSRLREDSFDLKKAHYWHQEATGNGSLESQTALGMMYEHGIGISKSEEHAFKCFKSAAGRGSVYAMGNLALKYYQCKMFRNSCDLAKKVASLEDFALISRQTDCLEAYIRKGIALGCFIYGRCIFKGIIDVKDETPAMWYSRAAQIDLDVAQEMQDLVIAGKI